MSFTGTIDNMTLTTTADAGWPFPARAATPHDNKLDGAMLREWKIFREEFIKKLLSDDPKLVYSFKRSSISEKMQTRVKVELEYEPDADKRGKPRGA